MNYKKIYELIINNAKLENRKKLNKNDVNYIYYEHHHIIPRCLNGTDEKSNLVLLTGREHFVCHKLLTYIYLKNRKIALAFHKMTFSKRDYKISSRDYEYARKLINEIPASKETREKIGLRTKGKTYKELYGENAEIQKQKRSDGSKKVKFTKERKHNISVSLKGKIPWNKGLTKNTDKRINKYVETRIKKGYNPHKTYIILTPENIEILFIGRKDLELYFKEINSKILQKKKRINVDSLIYTKEAKNYKLRFK
jgi:hypothetical protein